MRADERNFLSALAAFIEEELPESWPRALGRDGDLRNDRAWELAKKHVDALWCDVAKEQGSEIR